MPPGPCVMIPSMSEMARPASETARHAACSSRASESMCNTRPRALLPTPTMAQRLRKRMLGSIMAIARHSFDFETQVADDPAPFLFFDPYEIREGCRRHHRRPQHVDGEKIPLELRLLEGLHHVSVDLVDDFPGSPT